jgi:Cu(I)/Ag(I) efflux system membrane fusion protein
MTDSGRIDYRPWKMRFVRAGLAIAAVCVLVAVGIGIGRLTAPAGEGSAGPAAGGAAESVTWTCSMHPQIKLPRFGQCPLCFMDLVPVKAGAGGEAEGRLSLSPRAQVLARIETSPVAYRDLVHDVRMVGKIAADETRVTHVSSYFPGRLERLFVNYTGILVNEGDHLAEVYSPDLLVAQQEYLLALEAQANAAELAPDAPARRGANALAESAERKLQLWGIPADEIERLKEEKQASDRMRIDAPVTGWVLEREGFPGMYVETGTRLFTLTDLRVVWVMLDAYEMDLGMLRYGQLVEFEAEAYPGRKFEGRIAYIDPTLTESTRTVKVRVNVPNDSLQLRPGMFVRARLRVHLGEGGQVVEPSLVGKWISPMHPEIVKDGPGTCDVCGMALVPSESLGFIPPSAATAKVLSIPRTAALRTGLRAVVYVEVATDDEGTTYEGREVELGPIAGEFQVVRSGLVEGERVVTRGALYLDSAMQIQAKPSMMQPDGLVRPEPTETAEPGSTAPPSLGVAGAGYHAQMRPALNAAVALTDRLAEDDEPGAVAQVALMRKALAGVEPAGLEGESADVFRAQVEAMRAALPEGEKPAMKAMRDKLVPITAAVEMYLRTFGHDRDRPLVRMYCPMAFDNRGAGWLSVDSEVRNPYFGADMYHCGERRGAIAPSGKEER